MVLFARLSSGCSSWKLRVMDNVYVELPTELSYQSKMTLWTGFKEQHSASDDIKLAQAKEKKQFDNKSRKLQNVMLKWLKSSTLSRKKKNYNQKLIQFCLKRRCNAFYSKLL